MAGKWVLAVCGTPQVLTMWTSCAAWMISWHGCWLPPEWVNQKSPRWKPWCLLWPTLASQMPSFWTYSTGHIRQPWFSVDGLGLRMWGLLRAFWKLALRKILCLKIWNSTMCVYVCFLPFTAYLPCIKNCHKCFKCITVSSFHRKHWDKCYLTDNKTEAQRF